MATIYALGWDTWWLRPSPPIWLQQPAPDPCSGQGSDDPAGSLTRDTACPLILARLHAHPSARASLTMPSEPSPHCPMPSNNQWSLDKTRYTFNVYFHTMWQIFIQYNGTYIQQKLYFKIGCLNGVLYSQISFSCNIDFYGFTHLLHHHSKGWLWWWWWSATW